MPQTTHNYTVLVADDELAARKLIIHYLKEEDDFEVVAESKDGLETLTSIESIKPDLVFLDIEMPEISGIELVGQLEPPLPLIVFITAYNEHAIKAFEENALDYILKPFDESRFQKTLNRIRESMTNTPTPPSLDLLQETLRGLVNTTGDNQYLKKIACKQKGIIKLIPTDQIFWIESEGSFCKLHLEASFVISNLSIKKLEELIDPKSHLRIHRSHMVNVDKIESIEPYFHGEYMVNLNNGVTLKLSRSYKEKLGSILNQYQ